MSPKRPPEWGLLLKARFVDDSAPDRAKLESILAQLPGPDRKLTIGTADFTVSWWVDAADAAAAAVTGAAALRAACQREGLPELVVIRAHAASVEGRFPAWQHAEAHLDAPDWAVDIKAAAPPGHPPADNELLARVRDALGSPDTAATLRGDPEKFLLDDGSGFTVRFWTSEAAPARAYRAAREQLLTALARAGLEGWTLVRFKARTPRHAHADTFPGASARTPRHTEEMR